MARITITIEDLPEGGVSVVSDPNFETMAMMDRSGHRLTSAHGYAISTLNHMRKVSKNNNEKDSLVKIPKLTRV